jgi:hypothetical protein
MSLPQQSLWDCSVGIRCSSYRTVGLLFFVVVFPGNVVLGYFMRCDLPFVRVQRVFHPAHRFRLERLSLFFQLFHALRIGAGDLRQSLSVSRLVGTRSLPSESPSRA